MWSDEKNMGLSGLCQNSVTAPYCKDWEPRYPKNTSWRLPFQNYQLDTPTCHPQHLPSCIGDTPTRDLQRTQGAYIQQQTPTNTKRQLQTPQYTERCRLSVSGGVCWRLLSSVSISCSLEISGGCLGDVWWVFGGILVVFMDIWGALMCLGGICLLSPCSMEP